MTLLRPGGKGRVAARSGNRFKARRETVIRPGRALVWLLVMVVVAVLLATVSLGLLVGFRWLTVSPHFALRDIVVTGCQRLTPDEVIEISGARLGQNVLELKISDIEERLTANPWTEIVMVRRVPPSELQITIRERRPAYWMRTAEGLAYVDEAGMVIDRVGPDRLISLPLLDTDDGGEPMGPELTALIAGIAESGMPVDPAKASLIRLGGRSVKLVFDEPALTLVVERDGWERNIHRLGLVWNDLVRRGEADRVRGIRIVGGKVFVKA
ncbi:cell division protein FtsQ [Desulfobaculum xiamenense]|uniref:Cell division protein FtsQ n=1 Tax=Desulfobaculum xiamenense TaxID=995050 RepID=A0A846QSZ9_9BACT|nr:FtsQ-type POTRA domain-containing protein [Desulfobaculum xiamenense]NJB67769.1 cell division protein FtsQ [Desulfobaculum xiamenense]